MLGVVREPGADTRGEAQSSLVFLLLKQINIQRFCIPKFNKFIRFRILLIDSVNCVPFLRNKNAYLISSQYERTRINKAGLFHKIIFSKRSIGICRNPLFVRFGSRPKNSTLLFLFIEKKLSSIN